MNNVEKFTKSDIIEIYRKNFLLAFKDQMIQRKMNLDKRCTFGFSVDRV